MVCFKDERKKENPMSLEVQRQCEDKMTPTKFPMFSIVFAAQDLYIAPAWHKSSHQPTSFFIKSPFQFSFYILSSKLVNFSCISRHEIWPWGSEDLYKEPWERKSNHMPLKECEENKKAKLFFSVPVHVRNWIKAKKGTKILDRVKAGGKNKTGDKLKPPQNKRP